MRIQVRLLQTEPEVYPEEPECPHCGSAHLKAHGEQGYEKALRDLHYASVKSYRCKCLRYGRTFRLYPQGVDQGQHRCLFQEWEKS